MSRKKVAVIGAGPAGLRAAQVLAEKSHEVHLFDSMRSAGRKFLVAGKSGLNLTHDEDWENFCLRYTPSTPNWRRVLDGFTNHDLRQWAADLGIETFAASSGKVFPVATNGQIKAAPLLMRWLARLRELGVVFHMNHRWSGFPLLDGASSAIPLEFIHQQNRLHFEADAALLALGGASWPRTGSDGSWVKLLEKKLIQIRPLEAANCGWEADWPDEVIQEAAGLPIKNLAITAGEGTAQRRGELVITRYGLEGGPIYHLGTTLRRMPAPWVEIDFKPDLSHAQLCSRLGSVKRNFIREAKRRWKLDPATCALLKRLPHRGPWKTVSQLATEVKNCHISLTRPRPIEEAISSAGGICWSELDEGLMLKKIPRVFAAGEMLDWEAPTGGYLMQGCFASGQHAALAIHQLLS